MKPLTIEQRHAYARLLNSDYYAEARRLELHREQERKYAACVRDQEARAALRAAGAEHPLRLVR